eukprot:3198643-Pyramimonas_sp.AAC.1
MHQVMMQSSYDMSELRTNVQNRFTRCSQLTDQIVLLGQDVKRRHEDLQNHVAFALKEMDMKVAQLQNEVASNSQSP